MADVSNELMYELLKRIHTDIGGLKLDLGEVKREMNSIRGHIVATQSDIQNIYGILARHDDWLERIERRLELREFAEPPAPFRHGP